MPKRGLLPCAFVVAASCWSAALAWTPQADSAEASAVIRILEQRSCKRCNLQDADLVNADLRDSQLQGAKLQRANLSGARLDRTDLRQADLSFTSLAGASLQGADLRGATLIGTDLRNADLTDAKLDASGLSRSHWQQAKGVATSIHSYAELHNAGVNAAQEGRHSEAERWFGFAIKRMPDAAISWVGRGLSRADQGDLQMAAQDLRYAAELYSSMGDIEQSKILNQAADLLTKNPAQPKGGNGSGSHLVTAAIVAFQMLAPLAAKIMLPMPF